MFVSTFFVLGENHAQKIIQNFILLFHIFFNIVAED
jgi:hypothetical protein